MSEEYLEEYGNKLWSIIAELTKDMLTMQEDSERYKDAQYFLELVDIIYGSTELCAAGSSAREKDLNTVKIMINKLEVMK